uniref:Cyclin-J n=1 Tax=Eptatretus burgeri TaxID=7764 RepID=A0A8C4PY64_EPTBU
MAHQHWWTQTLATDNYRSLCEQESRLRPFLARSPQLCLRRCLSDWIVTLGQQLHLRSITRHLAVLMLDLFMERHDVPPTKLLPTALGCLVIACKFEEHEENIPRRKNLAEVLNLCLPGVSVEILLGGDVMLQTEMQVLAGLSWDLFLPTAAHFSDYFLTLALQEVSIPSHQGCDKLLYLRRYTSYFLELSLQDHVHLNFPPSLVAASCVSAARMCVHLPPTWPGQLQQLIGYNLQQLLPCMELLIRLNPNFLQCTVCFKSVEPSGHLFPNFIIVTTHYPHV